MNLEIIITTLITGLFTVIVALITRKNRSLIQEKQELLVQNEKIINELAAISILFNHKFIILLNETIEEVFSNSKATRFVMLFAVNGKTDFNHVTACFERNKNPEFTVAAKKYNRLKVDPIYKQMLKRLEFIDKEVINTRSMEPSLLKNIYESFDEQIENSLIYFLDRITIDPLNDLLLYCSIATTDRSVFNNKEIFLIDTNIDRIKNESIKRLSVTSEF
jgi:hypothetical protein